MIQDKVLREVEITSRENQTGLDHLRPLCPMRWTVKAKSFESVRLNYYALLETIHTIVSEKNGTFQVVAKAGGIHKNMENFDVFFGIMLGEKFFGITHLLSSSLQGKLLPVM